MAKSKANEWLEKDKLTLLEGWARNGLTDEQIANNMGIATSTFYDWKNKHPEIAESLKKNKEIVDIEVENALLKKALGYTITLHKQKVTKDGDVVDIKEEVHIAPDTTAQIFWLKNRKKAQWRDKVEYENTGENKNGVMDELVEALKNVKKD